MTQMKSILPLLLLITVVGVLSDPSSGHAADPPPALHRIAVRFHLVTDMPMVMKGVALTNWLTPEMIEKTVMPEVNRIWAAAGIEWQLGDVRSTTTLSGKRAEVIAALLKAVRDSAGRSDPERIKQVQSILDLQHEDPQAVNLYVVPYLGGTSQGHALPGRRRVMLGQWTDKPSHGLRPPEKCLLIENGEFKRGSFSRTVAHELGHILGLQHPAKNVPPFHRLMGGSNPGNDLTDEEKAAAQQKAAALFSPSKAP
jgi:hypothetical protein